MKKYDYYNMVGKKFGFLKVLKVIKVNNQTKIRCLCRCNTKKVLSPYSVLMGKVVSCGCHKTKNLIKARIKAENFISYEDMLAEVAKGKTDKQIALEFGFSRLTIGILRRKYKIKSKFSGKSSTLNEVLLTDEQKEIILGTSLGDGYIAPNGTLHIAHCAEQYPYLYWLHHKLKPLVSGGISNCKKTNSFNFSTKSLDLLKQLRKELYPKGKKVVSKRVLNLLSPLALAVWFMDDGSRNGSNNFLHTEGFTHSDRKLITQYLKEKWGIKASIRKEIKHGKTYYLHFFDAENSFKLAQIVKYHVLPSMLCKIRKDSKQHIVYLAGGMQLSPDGGVKWRRNLRLLLNKKGYYCIDPTKEEPFILLSDNWRSCIEDDFGRFQENMRKIIKNDLNFVNTSESVVCLYDEFLGGGSYHEIGESYLKNKKLYIVNINRVPLAKMNWWVLGCATKIVNTYEELLALFPDISNQKYVRTNGRKGKKLIKRRTLN